MCKNAMRYKLNKAEIQNNGIHLKQTYIYYTIYLYYTSRYVCLIVINKFVT